MCIQKTWTRFLAKTTESGNVSIIATRSDSELFTIPIRIARRDTIFETAERVVKAINTLETYRNCECSSSFTCNKHLEFVEPKKEK